ncbi:hypothetical protein DFO67_10419 [Modicisalibacter xianhensis]|uniref:Bbp19-like phage domain-containing protein n=1 Tax=Modicisalibacter xianhensis TaxID=442341 RepID=A0A4R8FVD5_9GAMM|nr:hypothetical protein [Halomonas xianhensis]TDX30764.1 hypothetical protein DFO67_10419 [Halomonas xianhensis]
MTHEEMQEKRLAQREDDMRWMLEHEQGRRILFALIESTGTFSQSFTGNSGSFFNDGRKSVGQDVFHEVMRLDPKRFTQMWTEHQEATARAEAQLDSEE